MLCQATIVPGSSRKFFDLHCFFTSNCIVAVIVNGFPFQLLQTDLLVGVGYCLRAQRKDDNAGDKKLELAKDKYCRLVTGKSYKSFADQRVRLVLHHIL